jgi:electron transfer flavoprotein alpha subunit
MPTLVLAEHDNATLRSATLHAVTAASKLSDEVHVLVVGHNAMPVAESASALAGVVKVLCADAAYFAQPTAENVAAQILLVVKGGEYKSIVAGATGFGKNVLPRVARSWMLRRSRRSPPSNRPTVRAVDPRATRLPSCNRATP